MMENKSPVSAFLVYAHEDEPLLKELVKHLSLLKRQKIISIWYDRQVIPGTNWSKVIDEHLEQASIILLLVSADFLASDYCYHIEMQRALARHEVGKARVIPIMVRPADWKGAPFAYLQALPRDARAITSWSNQDEAFLDVVAGIRRAIEDLSLLPANLLRTNLPPIWNIPYPRNFFFTGRDAFLSQLHTQLQTGQATALSQSPQAISGLGGIGKTQIAVAYAYRYSQNYEAVLWAQAENKDALISSYNTIATLLKLPERNVEEQEITIGAVKSWFQAHHKWLLILDNADDLDILPPFLPPTPGGHILLTTRAWDMQRLATRLEVETFSDEQGAEFLLRRAGLLALDMELAQAVPIERAHAMHLTQDLGGLPLALDQAGAYLEATGMNLQEYHRMYQKHRQALLRERRSRILDHPEPVATTWLLSFERIEAKSPAAADLLRLCAYLSPDAIPEEVILKGAPHLGSQLAAIGADPYLLSNAIEALRAYSLVSRDPRTLTLSVHRLVQAVLRENMEAPMEKVWKQRAILAVNAACPHLNTVHPNPADKAQWYGYERWLSHALVGAYWIEQEQMTSPEAASVLNTAGYYLDNRAQYVQAEHLYQQALTIREQRLGPEHPDTATSLDNLAELFRAQGKLGKAVLLQQRALTIREQRLGPEHPDTAISLNNLAVLYHMQGRSAWMESFYGLIDLTSDGVPAFQEKYTQAESLYQRALAIRERQLGPEHLDTALSLNNLAQLYANEKRYTQAESFYQRALAIRERQLGPEHPDTAASLNNLAVLYDSQGKYAQAELLYQRALTISEQQLGTDHPDTQAVRRSYTTLLLKINHNRRRRGWKRLLDLFSR